MRRSALTLLPVLLPLAACASQPVQTAADTTRQNIGGAVSAPLQDFNLVRSQIPEVLREAVADPYQRPEPTTCITLGAELARLNDALGPDVDSTKTQMTRTDKGAQYVAKSAVAAVKDVSEGWIPLRSWVRYASGAQGHIDAVASAINAGEARRAYLKGLAQSQGCPNIGPRPTKLFPAPPDTPSTVTQTVVPTRVKTASVARAGAAPGGNLTPDSATTSSSAGGATPADAAAPAGTPQ